MEKINIDRLINSVGSHTFIKYFFEFKHLEKREIIETFQLNNESWKKISYEQKANNGKRIFNEKREIEALRHIIENKKKGSIPSGKKVKRIAEIYLDAFSKIIPLVFFIFFISCNKNENQLTQTTSKHTESSTDSVYTDKKENKVIQKDLPIKEIIKLSQKHFLSYKKKLLEKNTTINSSAYTGDFTNDGREDVVIEYGIEPTDGGNYLIGQGLVLYRNNGGDISFITNYKPDYLFSFDKVSGGNIFISKEEYAEDDPRCCPSLHKQIELTINDYKIYERTIK